MVNKTTVEMSASNTTKGAKTMEKISQKESNYNC